MAQSLTLTRDQLAVICHNDQQAIRTLELTLLGINQLPDLEDGIDDNTLAISTLSDLVRPITINLIEPLPAPVGADTTYTLTGGEATEGMKTVVIPAASLVATAAGPFTLTITTGLGTDALVPITVSTNSITSGALMFDIHIDSVGNITSKYWEISGTGALSSYLQKSTGDMQITRMLALGTSGQTWTFPIPFFAAPIVELTMIPLLTTDARFCSHDPASTTAVITRGWNDAGGNSGADRDGLAYGRWRA